MRLECRIPGLSGCLLELLSLNCSTLDSPGALEEGFASPGDDDETASCNKTTLGAGHKFLPAQREKPQPPDGKDQHTFSTKP